MVRERKEVVQNTIKRKEASSSEHDQDVRKLVKEN